MEFLYPNLVAGTDVPTAWFEPLKWKPNIVTDFFTVDFPRPLAEGDVVATIGAIRCTIACRVDNCGGGRLRARRLMVTLNGDGAPHAWAPASGEVWP